MQAQLVPVGDDLVAHIGTFSVTLNQGEVERPYFYRRDDKIDALREKARKRLERAMKPECSRCHKLGAECRNRQKCNERRHKAALKGFEHKRFEGLALPKPPQDWMIARGYATYGEGTYYSGGRTKRDPVNRLRMKPYVDHYAMNQHYAYDLAMGVSWDDEAELAA
jgi:hypothetical protein